MSYRELHWLGTNEGDQSWEDQQTPLSAKDHLVRLPIGMQAPVRMWDLIPGGYPELWGSWALSPLLSSKTNPMKPAKYT